MQTLVSKQDLFEEKSDSALKVGGVSKGGEPLTQQPPTGGQGAEGAWALGTPARTRLSLSTGLPWALQPAGLRVPLASSCDTLPPGYWPDVAQLGPSPSARHLCQGHPGLCGHAQESPVGQLGRRRDAVPAMAWLGGSRSAEGQGLAEGGQRVWL